MSFPQTLATAPAAPASTEQRSATCGSPSDSTTGPTSCVSSSSSTTTTRPLEFSIPLRAATMGRAITTSSSTKKIGGNKRATRDESPLSLNVMTSSSPSAAKRSSSDMDLTMMSSLCHELLETKKRMMMGTTAASPLTDGSSRSDEDVMDATTTTSEKVPTKSAASSPLSIKLEGLEGLSADAIRLRKAQRRREQVRAASRRCRDRQRKETEDLRKKVFQLEEFISHTIKSYEWELKRQRDRTDELQQENEQLRRRLADAECERQSTSPTVSVSANVSPVGVEQPLFDLIKTEDDLGFLPPAQLPVDCLDDSFSPCSTEYDLSVLYGTVEDTQRVLIDTLASPIQPVLSTQGFGWNFDFWVEGSRYFAKNRKFFSGIKAHELAQRQHRISSAKYMETFPEVTERKVLKVIDDNVHIQRTVKALPGKPQLVSLTLQSISQDEQHTGDRWVVATRSIGKPSDLNYGIDNECNGYVLEDIVKVLGDGSSVEGCLVQGVGAFETNGRDPHTLIQELAKAFASVVIRWESLFINDFITTDHGFEDIELDFYS